MPLATEHRHFMRLARQDADPEGWAKVSEAIWPFVAKVPDDLMEKDAAGLRVRLTGTGEAVLLYT